MYDIITQIFGHVYMTRNHHSYPKGVEAAPLDGRRHSRDRGFANGIALLTAQLGKHLNGVVNGAYQSLVFGEEYTFAHLV